MKKIIALLVAMVMIFAVTSMTPAAATTATAPGSVCDGLDSGKIDVSGNKKTVTVTAPDGQLISGYCVKAGSVQNGNGPEYFDVDPPVKTLTISHTSGKDISHYSLSYVTDTPPTDVCPNIPGDQTTVPDGMVIDDNGDCVTPPPPHDECPDVPGNQPPGTDCNNPPPPPHDECPDMPGDQPEGTDCDEEPPVDVCPNIDGDQSEIPDGYEVDENGDCVLIPEPEPKADAVVKHQRIDGCKLRDDVAIRVKRHVEWAKVKRVAPTKFVITAKAKDGHVFIERQGGKRFYKKVVRTTNNTRGCVGS